MDATTENKIRTSEAEYNMRIARTNKNHEVMICQTLKGNVRVSYFDGQYTVYRMATLDEMIKDENFGGELLATGKKSEVIETIKALFEIVEQ